jgi:NAD(P)-dependent dehydrogenase (short-subunit alcohol dehydrogenase family)
MPTVLVTGANRGIGLEFVRQYAEDGARVLAACRDPQGATALGDLTRETSGRVQVLPLDVASDASVAALAAAVGAEPIDILIANAGIMGPQDQQQPGRLDFDGWLETLSVNALGPVRVASALHANLKAGRAKRLVAITSGMGSIGGASGGYFAYRSSKAALNMAWRNLAFAWKSEGMICVAMSPGWVQTDMGGAGADLTPAQSVSAMRRLIDDFGPKDSGRFVGSRGDDVEW